MLGFFGLTTEVSPGAGTRIAAEELANNIFLQKVKAVFGSGSDISEITEESPLPVTVIQGGGVPFFAETPASGIVTTPGTEQELIEFTVAAGKVRYLSQAVVSCFAEGRFTVMVGSDIIGSGRTGPSKPNAPFTWKPSRPIQPGEQVQVFFRALPGTPVRPIEAYVQASDRNV